MAKNLNSIVVLKTDRADLILRSAPTNAEVKKFVEEHDRRYRLDLPGGPDMSFAHRIDSARRYEDEHSYQIGEPGREIKINDIIPR